MITCSDGYRAFSHDVTVAMLVYQANPLGIELYFCANTFFCFIKPIRPLVTWVKTLHFIVCFTTCLATYLITWFASNFIMIFHVLITCFTEIYSSFVVAIQPLLFACSTRSDRIKRCKESDWESMVVINCAISLNSPNWEVSLIKCNYHIVLDTFLSLPYFLKDLEEESSSDPLAVVNQTDFEPGSSRKQDWDPGCEEIVLKEAVKEMNELDVAIKEVRVVIGRLLRIVSQNPYAPGPTKGKDNRIPGIWHCFAEVELRSCGYLWSHIAAMLIIRTTARPYQWITMFNKSIYFCQAESARAKPRTVEANSKQHLRIE